jgi:hypothetical protein
VRNYNGPSTIAIGVDVVAGIATIAVDFDNALAAVYALPSVKLAVHFQILAQVAPELPFLTVGADVVSPTSCVNQKVLVHILSPHFIGPLQRKPS